MSDNEHHTTTRHKKKPEKGLTYDIIHGGPLAHEGASHSSLGLPTIGGDENMSGQKEESSPSQNTKTRKRKSCAPRLAETLRGTARAGQADGTRRGVRVFTQNKEEDAEKPFVHHMANAILPPLSPSMLSATLWKNFKPPVDKENPIEWSQSTHESDVTPERPSSLSEDEFFVQRRAERKKIGEQEAGAMDVAEDENGN